MKAEIEIEEHPMPGEPHRIRVTVRTHEPPPRYIFEQAIDRFVFEQITRASRLERANAELREECRMLREEVQAGNRSFDAAMNFAALVAGHKKGDPA